MKKSAALALIFVLLFCLCAAAGLAESPAKQALVDNGKDKDSKLNMRAEPSRSSSSLGMFYSGVQVTIVADAGDGWSQVSIGGGQHSVGGYMMSTYLSTGNDVVDATFDMTVTSPYGTQSIVLRDCPSDSFQGVAVLAVGVTVRVLGTSGDFYYVRMSDGTVGCLANDELK